METKGKAFSKVARIMFLVSVPFSLGTSIFLIPAFLRHPSVSGTILFSLPILTLLVSLTIAAIAAQFSYVKVTDRYVAFRHFIREKRYEWEEIDRLDYPAMVLAFTPHALLHLRNEKKIYVGCGEGNLRDLMTAISIGKYLSKTEAEPGASHNGGKPPRES